MSKPIPTAQEIEAIQSTVSSQTTMQNALIESAALQQPEIDKALLVDDAFRKLFDWYNDKIIGKYDIEKKAINGIYVTSPVVENDIINVASNPPTGRLVPVPPIQDIVRIPEFDGGNTSTSTLNEQQHILDQTNIEDVLVNGYGAGSFPGTLTTNTALTPSSTTLSLIDSATAITSVVANTIFVVSNGGNLAVVKCLTITPNNPGVPPPYVSDLTIELIVAPSGTIASGQTLDSFTGFTNLERTAKITSDPDFQPLMDYLIQQLELYIGNRQTRLTEQLSSLNTNEDPDGIAEISTAIMNIGTSNTFLTNYLLTTDISDTGLTSLSTERTTRSGQLITRLTQINAAYTGQTENYYDMRYSQANNRGNTSRGTLRAKSNAESVKNNNLNMASGLSDSISSLNSILP